MTRKHQAIGLQTGCMVTVLAPVVEAAREREKLYIFSSHLGLIRCLTPSGSVPLYTPKHSLINIATPLDSHEYALWPYGLPPCDNNRELPKM